MIVLLKFTFIVSISKGAGLNQRGLRLGPRSQPKVSAPFSPPRSVAAFRVWAYALHGMDVQVQAVRTLLAVRQFADKPVPADLVERIIEAAHVTASASNKQPWHFVVVQERATLQRLGQLAQSGPYIAQAPMAVVVAIDKSSPLAVSDGSRAIQDMMLVAWSEGVGSNWVGFRNLPAEVSALLGIFYGAVRGAGNCPVRLSRQAAWPRQETAQSARGGRLARTICVAHEACG